jgi:hypothetical protein
MQNIRIHVPKKDVQNRTETLGLREASGKQFYFD